MPRRMLLPRPELHAHRRWNLGQAAGRGQLAGLLIDLQDDHGIGLLIRSQDVLAAGVDAEVAGHAALGRLVADVSEQAGLLIDRVDRKLLWPRLETYTNLPLGWTWVSAVELPGTGLPSGSVLRVWMPERTQPVCTWKAVTSEVISRFV